MREALRLTAALVCATCALRADDLRRSITLVEVPVDRAKTVCQKLVPGDKACVPATVLNALRFGPPSLRKVLDKIPGSSDKDKLAYVIAKYGSARSVTDPSRSIWDAKDGILTDDFPTFVKAILKGDASEHLAGMYFDKQANEKPEDLLRRIHRLLADSLRQEVPVITSIRSFAATWESDKYLWDGITAHAILIVGVPERIEPEAQGFVVEFIDPWSGALREGYVFYEDVRGFVAIKGSGPGKPKWIDRGFLQIVSPALVLETDKEPWYARSFMTLNYGVGRFEKAP